jgi:hypothetical protein
MNRRSASVLIACLVLMSACSTGGTRKDPTAQSAHYGKLSSEREFDADMPTLWKAIERAVSGYQIVSRDPDKVDVLEMRKLRQRQLETDWIYSQSRDKYDVAWSAGVPKQVPLQSRIKYKVHAEQQMGGILVQVWTSEELETLAKDGSSNGYHSVDAKDVDPSRAAELLDKIRLALLSPAP